MNYFIFNIELIRNNCLKFIADRSISVGKAFKHATSTNISYKTTKECVGYLSLTNYTKINRNYHAFCDVLIQTHYGCPTLT